MKYTARHNSSKVRLMLYSMGIFLAVAVCFSAIRTFATDGSSPSKAHLLTVYDRGQETTLVTDATTVDAALSEAHILLDTKDAVEPARNFELVGKEYDINIYRARPVTVIDGGLRLKVVSPYQSVARIAQDAGITLYPEDTAAIHRTEDLTSGGAGLVMTIDRASVFSFELYGSTIQARTQATDVAGILAEKSIKLGAEDKVSPSLDTPVTSGMNVRVWREGVQVVRVDEPIAFEKQTIYDGDRPIGYQAVSQPGVAGVRSVTYQVIITNGTESSRSEIASLVTATPKTQIEVVGVKYESTTSPSENEAITWKYLSSQGFTRNQTAGIMGNLMQEHRFNTTDVSGGLGIAQWTGSRRAALMSRGNYLSIYTQLDYLMYELLGKERGAYDAVRSSGSLEDATRAFQNRFERCGICVEQTRISYAYQILGRY